MSDKSWREYIVTEPIRDGAMTFISLTETPLKKPRFPVHVRERLRDGGIAGICMFNGLTNENSDTSLLPQFRENNLYVRVDMLSEIRKPNGRKIYYRDIKEVVGILKEAGFKEAAKIIDETYNTMIVDRK